MGSVGGEDTGEDGVVMGDAVGECSVSGGGEVDFAPGRMLLHEVFEERVVVGETGDIERDGVGDVLLECGFALGEPTGNLEDGARILAGKSEDGVDQCVSFDQGSVEIDAKGDFGVDFFRVGGRFSLLQSDSLGCCWSAFGLQGCRSGLQTSSKWMGQKDQMLD